MAHTKKQKKLRCWCREKYGEDWYANDMRLCRLREANDTLYPVKKRNHYQLTDRLHAWCVRKYGSQWHEGGSEEARMAEALREMMPKKPPMDLPDCMILWAREDLWFDYTGRDIPKWIKDKHGIFSGYHAVAFPTAQMLAEQRVTLYGSDTKYTMAMLEED